MIPKFLKPALCACRGRMPFTIGPRLKTWRSARIFWRQPVQFPSGFNEKVLQFKWNWPRNHLRLVDLAVSWFHMSCIENCPKIQVGSVWHCVISPKKISTRWSPRTRMLTRMLMVQMSKHMVMQWRTIPFCNSLFEQSCTWFPLLPVCSVEWKV